MTSTARLFAYRSYRDAPAAIGWLEALGFAVAVRQDAGAGTVQHCELRLGEAVVMLSSYDADDQVPELTGHSTGQGLYLLVDDVDAFHDAAIAAGGQIGVRPGEHGMGHQAGARARPRGVGVVVRQLRAWLALVIGNREGRRGRQAAPALRERLAVPAPTAVPPNHGSAHGSAKPQQTTTDGNTI